MIFNKKIKIIILLVIICNFSLALSCQAGIIGQIKAGFSLTGLEAGYNPKSDGTPQVEFTKAFGAYASGLAALMGFLFMCLTMYAGYLWMTARGNEEQVEKAKKIMIFAAIGIAVVITARLLTELALSVLEPTLPVAPAAAAVSYTHLRAHET